MVSEGAKQKPEQIFRDIRRYYCEYCGICRSKKALISAHILANHQDEAKEKAKVVEVEKTNTCEQCGASFTKPAYLKQHMQGHSIEGKKYNHKSLGVKHWIPQKNSKMQEAALLLEWISTRRVTACEAPSSEPQSRSERPFACRVDDCHSSYRRKDHLTRHLLQHQGKLFECSVGNCRSRFAYQGNLTRHLKEFHEDSHDEVASNVEHPKEHVCQEPGCGKAFRYPSRLRKHEGSHVKLDTGEAFCSDPGCVKIFTNEEYLKEHIRTCHQRIHCDKCGTMQLKKNFKRHLCMHEGTGHSQRISCSFEGCALTFSTASNLSQHIKAVHLEIKPFVCCFPNCGKRFAFKHARDNHEKSGCHVYTVGDFEESDEQFRSRPRGGLKRKCPSIETLMRKRIRILPPTESEFVLSQEST